MAEGLRLDVSEGARIGQAGIVDQAGSLAEALLGVTNGALKRGVVRDIGLGIDRVIGRQSVDRLDVPRDQQQGIAFLGEGARLL